MKWLLSLITAFILCVPSFSHAAEFIFTWPGNTADAWYDIYFEATSTGGGASYDVRTAVDTRSNAFISASQTHFWMLAKSDDLGECHVVMYTASNRVPALANVRITPYKSRDVDLYGQLFSFFVGALTSIAFVIAVETASKGGSV